MKCNFPWLLTNICNKETKEPIDGAAFYHIIEHKGKKIGFIGLAECQWVETLPYIEWEDIDFED